MMLSWSYLGHSGDTVLIPNLKLETKSEKKEQENIYKGNLIRYFSKESGVDNNE